MREIKLTNSDMVSIVDDGDYEVVSKHRWYLTTGGYVISTRRINGRYLYLHRFILNSPRGIETDHINQNKIDNRRANLRIATVSQNQANVPKRRDNITSRFKGVYWCKKDKRWKSKIGVHYKQIHLGSFLSEEEAARTYDEAALKHFGEFARVNF